MSAVCQVLGTQPGFGHSISRSHVRTKRRFNPNIDKLGIDVVAARILARGEKI